jgi:hypothetical protein
MEKPTDDQIEEARRRVKEFARTAATDPGVLEKLNADPGGTLTAAGIPTFAHTDFLREAEVPVDVSGYTTCYITCMCTCRSSAF